MQVDLGNRLTKFFSGLLYSVLHEDENKFSKLCAMDYAIESIIDRA